ncbi:hypothetical protein ACA910_016677 [Epithemia clementina (nom. ined.)]
MATLFGKRKRRRQDGDESGTLSSSDDLVLGKNDNSQEVPSLDDRITDHSKTTNKTSTTADRNDEVVEHSTLAETDPLPPWASLEDLGLAEPLVATCRQMGFRKPTAVQRTIIPFLLKNAQAHLLALAQTGSGKTAAFVLPILHRLAPDPYGIFAVILTPTRELAKQIHQQILALGSAYNVQSALVVGGLDPVKQSCALDQRPHFCVATPGRLAILLQGPKPPHLQHVRFMVLDEADRLLAANSGFERHVAELLVHCTTTTSAAASSTKEGENTLPHPRKRRNQCQTLLFSATMTRSLQSIEEMAGAGLGRLPLKKFVVQEHSTRLVTKKVKVSSSQDNDNDDEENDNHSNGDSQLTPKIPAGLKQEYVFMPARVRDAYVLTAIRHLLINGGRPEKKFQQADTRGAAKNSKRDQEEDDDKDGETSKARSAIVFVSTCERAALVSGILSQVGVENVALHSLLSQNRRLASLGKFKSQQVRVLVATDVASRGLDIPTVDLVLNSELPRNPLSYVHRVGRTARAGRRGRAISFVSESEIGLVHAAETISGRPLEKCLDVTDEKAIALLGPVTKAARLTKLKLSEIGFDELVQKFKERKEADRKERDRIHRSLKKMDHRR